MKGYIFRCNDKTKDEVFQRMLLGEEQAYLPLVNQIEIDDALFLYNTSTFEFSGIYNPSSEGREKIEADAWQGKFPSQIRFSENEATKTIPFNKIEKIITRYRHDIYPYMELLEEQVIKIMDVINIS